MSTAKVLTKTLNQMAKIMDGNVTIMYDVVENVAAAYAAMQAAGSNVTMQED